VITAESKATPYQTSFTNQDHKAFADTSIAKGGSETGFRPHELLEAALACCMNMWLRMYADNHQLPLSDVSTTVSVNRDQSGESIFEYSIDLKGSLTETQREKLMQIAKTCPVRQTLSKEITFRQF